MPAHVTRRARKSPPLRSAAVAVLANRMLRELDLYDRELSVLLTDDVFIRDLNLQHRGKDRSTDVLSFPQLDDPSSALTGSGAPLPESERLLGDVVISLDTALEQARRRRRTLQSEVCFLLAHGVLHLVGYDHESDEEEAEMNRVTRSLVKAALP